jgi:5-methylcytosine-specific restriction enzyme A
MRSPPWSRDELIVTLDFYLQYAPTIPGKTSSEIWALSDFLNRLQSKMGGERPDKFRNVNGVYMKLMNFLRFDPDYEGTGLTRGSKDEEVVWNLYASRPDELRKVSDSIRSFVSSDIPIPPIEVLSDDEEEGEEGHVLTRTHRYRERDGKLVKRKKDRVLRENGTLSCEVCGALSKPMTICSTPRATV